MTCTYLLKWTITVSNTAVTTAATNDADKKVVQKKSYAPFTDCISVTNNIQVDNIKDIDVVISMYNLIECNDNYSKVSRIL